MAKSAYYYVFRSSISGLFVSAAYAAKHPQTTERERRRRR